MPTLPDVRSLGGSSIPQSNRGIVSFDAGAGARGMQQAGQELQKISREIESADDDKDKVAAARALLRMKQEQAGLEDELRNNPADYEKVREQWKKRFGAVYDESEKTISGQKNKELFSLAAQESFLSSDGRFSGIQTGYRKEHIVADYQKNVDAVKRTLRSDMSDAEYVAAQTPLRVLTRDGEKTLGVDWQANADISTVKELDRHRLGLMPPDQAYFVTSAQMKTPVQTIMDNEIGVKGKIKVHADNKGMAIGGINSHPDAHPKEFAEAKRILETEGEPAAREFVLAFYQKKITDNGIDKLPRSVQDVVADGIINHGSGMQKKLLEAARNGATRNELLDMRQADYDRLAASPNAAKNKWDVSKAGWDSRIARLRGASVSDYQYDPDVAMSVNKQTEVYMRKDASRKADEDIAAAEMGLSKQAKLTPDTFLNDQTEYDSYLIKHATAAATSEYSTEPFAKNQKDIKESFPKEGDTNLVEKQKSIQIKQAAFNADVARWNADPAARAAEVSPIIKEMQNRADANPGDFTQQQAVVSESLRVQREKGVANPRILSESSAAHFVAGIQKAHTEGAENLLQKLDYLKASYGNEYFSQVIGEAGPKLSPALRALTSLDLSDNLSVPVAKDIAQNADIPTSDLSQSINTDDVGRIKSAVNVALAPLQKTLVMSNSGDGAATYRAVHEQALRVAYVHHSRGNGFDDSAAYATAPFIKNYEFSGAYRIPAVAIKDGSRVISASDAKPLVESATNRYLNTLTETDLYIPTNYKSNFASQDYVDAVKSKGEWVVNKDESGLRLVDQFGQPVFNVNGIAIQKTFSDLVLTGEEMGKEANELNEDNRGQGRFP